MARTAELTAVDGLKKQLQQEVAKFLKPDGRLWKAPVLEILCSLRSQSNIRAVFLGGTLRSLLVPRVIHNRPGRPRDIDIVVAGPTLDALKELFEEVLSRETRFGGLQLRSFGWRLDVWNSRITSKREVSRVLHRPDWRFDIWPLERTRAFVEDAVEQPSFEALPHTTFFNMEAIAVDVWPVSGRFREIYSGDDQFFKGILTRTLEINREDNPFPDLCVLRALVMSSDLGFQIGPMLARYVIRHGSDLTEEQFDALQYGHYGHQRHDPRTLRKWVEWISEMHVRDSSAPLELPRALSHRQLNYWSPSGNSTPLHFRTFSD